MSFSLMAPTSADSTFRETFFDVYVCRASLMASIEPSTSPAKQGIKCLKLADHLLKMVQNR